MVQAVGLGFPVPNIPAPPVEGRGGAAGDVDALERVLGKRPVTDPVGLVKKLAETLGNRPEKVQELAQLLQNKGTLTKEEEALLELLKLLIEAIKSGQVPAFLQALGNGGLGGGGGGLGNLVNNFLNGGGGGGGLGGLFNNFFGGGGGGGGGGGVNFERMRPWSEDDKRFIDTQLNTQSDFGDQIGAWRQGSEGNCSSVACIKAGFDRFGDLTGGRTDPSQYNDANKQKGVFKAVKPVNGGYEVTMRDDFKVDLTNQELSMARAASHFRSDNPEALRAANFAYAAMAKRALREGHEGSRSYSQALGSLANGENPRDTARFLGLKNHTVDLNAGNLMGQDAIVAWNNRHAFFMDHQNGRHLQDHYGSGRNGWGFGGAFTIKPASAPMQPFGPQTTVQRSARPSAPAARPAAQSGTPAKIEKKP